MSKGILYFSADWCGPCKQLGPIIDLAKSGGIPVEKINCDYDVFKVQKYQVKNIPTLIIIDMQGNEIKRRTGTIGLEQLKQWYNG
jgi:thioredoxin 1